MIDEYKKENKLMHERIEEDKKDLKNQLNEIEKTNN
jgi:hypothetical protein